MKKILFLFALIFSVAGFSGCEKDEIYISEKTLVMRYGDIAELWVGNLTGGDWVRWRSSNPFFATVNQNGVVAAQHVGFAYIYASVGGDEVVCEVYVDPTIEIYDEPIFEFGSSKNFVDRSEWRIFEEEGSDYLLYSDDKLILFEYLFEYNRLIESVVILDSRRVSPNDFDLFLDERYQYTGRDGNTLQFEFGDIGIDVFPYDDGVSTGVAYFPFRNRSLSRSTKSLKSESIQANPQAEKMIDELEVLINKRVKK